MAASSPSDERSEYLFNHDDPRSPVTSLTPFRFVPTVSSQAGSPLLFGTKSPLTKLKGADAGNTSLSALNYVASPFVSQALHGHHLVAESPLSSKNRLGYGFPIDPVWRQAGDEGLPSQGLVDFEDNPFTSDLFAEAKSDTLATPHPLSKVPATPTRGSEVKSAPSTITRRHYRSVSGLGTPSTMRSMGRKRQLTHEPGSNPVSPVVQQRRRVESSQSFTTTVPLSRNVSTTSMYSVGQDRNVSGMTSITASTSYEVGTPMFNAYTINLPPSQALPALIPSGHASPQPSEAPLYTPNQHGQNVFDSPETSQGIFAAQQGQLSLLQNMNMMHGHSAPNTESMMSVASFPNRHALGTIDETPPMVQEATMYSTIIPGSSLDTRSQFQAVDYPHVPVGAQYPQHPSYPLSVGEWVNRSREAVAQTGLQPQYAYPAQDGYLHPGLDHVNLRALPQDQYAQAPIQRHLSSSYAHAGPSSQPMVAPPMGSRSFSAPSFHSMMPTVSGAQGVGFEGGLFGRPRDGTMDAMDPYDVSSSQEMGRDPSSSTLTSPITPSKRKYYPRVGNPLRPGPKPKPKTPKKSQAGSSPPEQNLSTLPRIDEQPEGKAPLRLGGDLVEAMQRTTSSSSMVQPLNSSQPQLAIEPPKPTSAAEPVSGLPKNVLEKLYTTYMTMEGGGAPQKRFKCLIEGCDRSFPRKSAIHSHIQTHLEDKPFQCEAPDCGAAFVRQHDLRRHSRIHSGTKPFNCPCGKGFARGDALHRHRQRGICSGSIVPMRTTQVDREYHPY